MSWLELLSEQDLEHEFDSNMSRRYHLRLTIDELGYELSANASRQDMGLGFGDVWDALKVEFRLLVCTGDPKYETLRKEMDKLGGQSTTALVALISAALGAAIGVAASVIAPMAVLLLLAVTKVGTAAICKVNGLDRELNAGPAL